MADWDESSRALAPGLAQLPLSHNIFECVYVCSGGGEQDLPSSRVLILGVVQFLSTGIFTYNLSVYMVRVGELNTHSSLAFRVS